jgi:hypothetical protein
MRAVLLAVMILLASPLFAQQHAPTPDQCRSDVAVWLKDFDAWTDAQQRVGPQNSSALNAILVGEVEKRDAEMLMCGTTIDTKNHGTYSVMHTNFLYIMTLRLSSFIARHSLDGQFVEEDQAGRR